MIKLRRRLKFAENKKVGLHVAAPTGNTFVGARCSTGVAVSVRLSSPGGRCLFSART